MNLGVLYYMPINQKITLSERVHGILNEYTKKYGKPPSLLCISNKNEKVVLPKEIKLVVKSVRLPVNHVWIEIEDWRTEHD